MPKIFISTVPFGEIDSRPVCLLEESEIEFVVNPFNRKLTDIEIYDIAKDFDGIIAGTENLGLIVERSNHLKIISRVGIGLDSVPLEECRKKNIRVSYTPDAVTRAVAEMTVGIMICLTRHVCSAHMDIRNGEWKRKQGKRIGESVIGLIGFGRIGSATAKLLSCFHPKKILINDIKDKTYEINMLQKKYDLNISQVAKEEIYLKSDIVSLHVPLASSTINLIDRDVFLKLKNDAWLLNLARGGIVNENDAYDILSEGKISGAAIDCFVTEPYTGPLTKLKNVILTQHMGSCSYDCRAEMELQATEDMIRFFSEKPLKNEVPSEEYEYQIF